MYGGVGMHYVLMQDAVDWPYGEPGLVRGSSVMGHVTYIKSTY